MVQKLLKYWPEIISNIWTIAEMDLIYKKNTSTLCQLSPKPPDELHMKELEHSVLWHLLVKPETNIIILVSGKTETRFTHMQYGTIKLVSILHADTHKIVRGTSKEKNKDKIVFSDSIDMISNRTQQ